MQPCFIYSIYIYNFDSMQNPCVANGRTENLVGSDSGGGPALFSVVREDTALPRHVENPG